MKSRSGKSDYTMRNGKDAAISNRRQGMAESQHSSANENVRSEQARLKSMGGKSPNLDGRYMEFDACMTNNGAHAQEFAKKLTSGLDKTAFPVRQDVDKSQE